MKKIAAFIGTESRKATYQAVREIENNLKQSGQIDFEYVFLSDYNLEFCRGCKARFFKGEEFCPLKDDRDALLKKIENSDGVIFATPTYAGQVSARLKNFIDRLAFIMHRPRFFNKAFTAIVTQGLPIGSGTLKYLSMVGKCLGFHGAKGCCVTTLDPITESQRKKLVKKTKQASARFYEELLRPAPPPSFFWLVAFRMARTSIKPLGPNFRDYQYYKEKGWFEADYYYATSLGFMKRLAGSIIDFIAKQMVKRQ